MTLGALVGGVVLIVAFVRFELRSKAPLLDPRLFRHRGFATGSASLFLQFFAMFGFFFVALQFLQLVLGYSALTAARRAAADVGGDPAVVGRSRERCRSASATSSSVAPGSRSRPRASALFATLGTGSGYWPFLAATLVIGAGAALAMTPATNAIVSSLPRAKQGVASAVNDTARELGAAFGVAVLGSAFNTGYRHDIAGHLGDLPAAVAGAGPRSAGDRVEHRPRAARRLGARARGAAGFVIGMRYALLLGVGLLVVGALFVWFRGTSGDRRGARRRPRPRGGPDPRILTRTIERVRRRACRVSLNSAV